LYVQGFKNGTRSKTDCIVRHCQARSQNY